MSTLLKVPEIPPNTSLVEWNHGPTWEKPTPNDLVAIYENVNPGSTKLTTLIEGVRYLAPQEYLSTIGWGRKYFLMFWLPYESEATEYAAAFRKKYTVYGFVVQKIEFTNDNGNRRNQYGIYTTKKRLPRYPLSNLIHRQNRDGVYLGW